MARKPADQSVNRDDIIAAAADVLRRNGYDATTMKDIAAQVKLTAASLYHHFRSKDFLLLAVLELGLDFAIDQLETILQRPCNYTEKLSEMIRAHIINVTKNTAVGAAMVFEMKALMNVKPSNRNTQHDEHYDEFIERRNIFFRRRAYFESLFHSVIQDGIAAGEFRPVDIAIFTKTILGANNWIGVWYKEGGRLEGTQVAERMIDTFLAALKLPPTV